MRLHELGSLIFVSLTTRVSDRVPLVNKPEDQTVTLWLQTKRKNDILRHQLFVYFSYCFACLRERGYKSEMMECSQPFLLEAVRVTLSSSFVSWAVDLHTAQFLRKRAHY